MLFKPRSLSRRPGGLGGFVKHTGRSMKIIPRQRPARGWPNETKAAVGTAGTMFKLGLFIMACAVFSLLSLIPLEDCLAGRKPPIGLEPVPSVPQRPEWKRFKILVWPFHTDVLRDFEQYRRLGLGGFEIDRGAGQEKRVELSLRERFPYYVGHAADKGYLYLTGRNVDAVQGKKGLGTRPNSLADPAVVEKMKHHLRRNIETAKKGFVLAYAFDDEISLGSFVTPCDVDRHPLSIAWFRRWLKKEYGTIEALNSEWESSFRNFEEVMPLWFDKVRGKARKPPISKWNLSPWMDFRHFMDFQFSFVLSELTRFANDIDPKTPAGFVGGQGPGPWGGYDYAMLVRAVQWMEAYDTHSTNEILRSFWNQERRPRMQTYFLTKNKKVDTWFLWYYMLHGNQAVIAWPEGWFSGRDRSPAGFVRSMSDVFREVQGPVSEPIVNPETVFDADPIGIYYSHPSIQAGWVMDVITHGKTWVNRKGSIDDHNQTAGILRNVWCKTLEDLGYQYDFISYLDVKEGRIDLARRYKVIILPRVICLSDREADALAGFVKNGGILVADYLCGLMDGHGKGRTRGVLDALFGIQRNENQGYMNGDGLTEIDGEKYQAPFLERFTYYDGAYRYKGIVVFERGTLHREGARGEEIRTLMGLKHEASVLITRKAGNGKIWYLNLSPVEYWAPEKRFSPYGDEWRKIVGDILRDAGLQPRVVVYEGGNAAGMIECLWWKNGKRRFLALVKNPTLNKDLPVLGESRKVAGITGKAVEIYLEFEKPVGLVNLRKNIHLGVKQVFRDKFKPWEGSLYEVTFPR